MNPNETDSLMDKIRIIFNHLKAALSKNYAWRDIANINMWMAYPPIRGSSAGATISGRSNLRVVWAVAGRHRMLLTALACTALFAILSQLWLLPLIKSMQAQLELRPVQWAQLQNLIKIKQDSPTGEFSASATSALSRNASSARNPAGSPLHETELLKVRAVLEARDIRPNVLRLTTDSPPRLEFQANEVLFSTWIEALDELRRVWRLYPNTVTAVATASPGLVNISSTLEQAPLEMQSRLP